MTDKTEDAVLRALANSGYKFRTVEGLAKELGLEKEKVSKVVETNKIKRSPIPDIHGRTLYTLREDALESRALTDPVNKEAPAPDEQGYLGKLSANLERHFIREGFRTLEQFERFFRDPNGESILKPPYSGIACENIRTALRLLEYEVRYGDRYDKELVQVVRRFQTDCEHKSQNGLFDPGTRKLLMYRLFNRGGAEMFMGMIDPTEHESYVNYGYYFRDPRVGDGLLKPHMSGIACTNIRTALRVLGYEIEYGEVYDEELAKIVLRFQTEHNHTSRDGFFGPGTRKLLVIILLKEKGADAFKRLQNPEQDRADVKNQRRHEQVDLPCLNEFIRPRFNLMELQALCFNAGIDPEEIFLQPIDKSSFVRELILYFQRRDQIYKLKELVEDLRPESLLDC